MAKKPEQREQHIEITEVSQGQVEVCLVGVTPLICNAMSSKARQELLSPSGKKTVAQKRTMSKHDPLEEFQQSFYRTRLEDAPTEILMPATAFKRAIAQVAVDLPGSTKSQIGRLVHVEGTTVSLWGIPEIFTAVVRNSDQRRTPDIRTRGIIPYWATRMTLTYMQPILSASVILQLLGGAGRIVGVGDWRPEKGSGNYGQFEVVSEHDERFKKITEQGGREAQVSAINEPESYDSETEKLLEWFEGQRREKVKPMRKAE